MAGIKRSEMLVTKVKGKLTPGFPIKVLSISGGKDSLAMWLLMAKRGIPNLVPVAFDGGWDWECAKFEIKRVEKITGTKCIWLDHRGAFDRILKERGWPAWNVRWCTGYKRDKLDRFLSSVARGHPEYEVESAIGIAADEKERIDRKGMRRFRVILPLVEMGIKEVQALRVCSHAGCHWKGHYLRMGRLSCWCCPWQKVDDLRELYSHHPELWKKINEMDKGLKKRRKFHWARSGLPQLNKRFAGEMRRGII